MNCPTCDFQNPKGATVCQRCGTRLSSAGPVTQADLARLEPYLSLAQATNLPPAGRWGHQDLASALAHLSRLLDRVIAHLPRHLVQVELAPGEVPAVGGAFLDGALLFADISGFTAMSERLNTLGKEGAEELIHLVNRYFGAMLEIIFAYGGDLFKFGGDALLAFFPQDSGGSLSGLRAAWAMQTAMEGLGQVETSLGRFGLQMKIGLNAGQVLTARVGSADEKEFVATGPAVNATAQAEALAQAGQILISPTMYERVRGEDWLRLRQGPAGHHQVESVFVSSAPAQVGGHASSPSAADLGRPGDTPVGRLRRTLAGLERLTPYLPPGLLPRLVADQEVSGEHRIVAVLFANFVGASQLIAELGQERAAEIAQALNQYFVTMRQAVARYGGVVNKVDLYDPGDKLMVLFGAPVAHENDAERAVRAALAMQAALTEAGPLPRQQRIGVSTGTVFAGHVGGAERREYTVMGDEVNLAARLMSSAAEGEILLSNSVQRKVSPFFELADRGQISLKGKRQPVSTFTIVKQRAQPEPVRGIRGLRSPLVGRAKEEATLGRLAQALRAGQGGVVSLIGNAGLGKSRLVAELRARLLEAGDVTWLEGRCLSYTQQVSYSAFTELIHAALGIVETDSESEVWAKLRRRVDALLPGEAGEDVLPYLAHFLSLPLSGPEAERVAYLEGEALQRQVLRAVTTLLEQIAGEQPLLLVFDDLHWADSASLALLERCLSLVERAPVLMLLIYRPERSHGCWALGQTAGRGYPQRHTEIRLSPLDVTAHQDEQLARQLLSLPELPPRLTRLIGRAEGNPFYVEEIIRTLIDQRAIVPDDGGWRLLPEADLAAVPDTLQGIIMTRMDRLMEEARRTLQLASVVGRIFRHQVLDWLASAAALAAHLDVSLASLQRAELVRERSHTPELEYGFKHVMVRDVAYESLLVRDRRVYHRLVGQHLEDVYTGPKREEVYELLAHHYSLSDDREKALVYLIQAGDKARGAYANPEAISLYRQAQALDRPQQRARVAEGLGDVLFHIGQYDEALDSFQRALGQRAEARQRANLHWRIGGVYEKRGEYDAALAACAQGIDLLTPGEDGAVEMARLLTLRSRVYQQQAKFGQALADGQRAQTLIEGTNHYAEIAQTHKELGNVYDGGYGQPAEAAIHFEQALAILERIGDEHGAAMIYNNLAILYYQTDPARSAEYFGRALKTMQRLGDVWGEAAAYMNLGIVQYARGDYAQAIDDYQRSLRMRERLGDNPGIADCHVNLGEAYRARGDPAQAIVHLEKSLSIAREIGASQTEAECQRQLAECYLETNDLERALAACDQVLQHALETGNRNIEGIIRHVLGKVHSQQDKAALAVDQLEQSVAVLHGLNREFNLASARYDYALALAKVGQVERAREQLSTALGIFERLDLPQERRRVQIALERLS